MFNVLVNGTQVKTTPRQESAYGYVHEQIPLILRQLKIEDATLEIQIVAPSGEIIYHKVNNREKLS